MEMKMKYSWIALFIITLSASANAGMFMCTMQDGSISYSDNKCSGNKESKRLDKSTFASEKYRVMTDYSLHQLCASQYPSNDSMRDDCVKLQSEAYADLVRIGHLYNE
jgi:hypothetical protein